MLLGAVDLESHQLEELRRRRPASELVLGDTEASQIFERQIDPAAAIILGDVAQDVGPLERQAALDGGRRRRRVAGAQMQARRQPDHRRDLVAIVVEFFGRLVAGDVEVGGGDAVDHFLEQ